MRKFSEWKKYKKDTINESSLGLALLLASKILGSDLSEPATTSKDRIVSMQVSKSTPSPEKFANEAKSFFNTAIRPSINKNFNEVKSKVIQDLIGKYSDKLDTNDLFRQKFEYDLKIFDECCSRDLSSLINLLESNSKEFYYMAWYNNLLDSPAVRKIKPDNKPKTIDDLIAVADNNLTNNEFVPYIHSQKLASLFDFDNHESIIENYISRWDINTVKTYEDLRNYIKKFNKMIEKEHESNIKIMQTSKELSELIRNEIIEKIEKKVINPNLVK